MQEFVVTLIVRALIATATLCGIAYCGQAEWYTYLLFIVVAIGYGLAEAWSDTSNSLWSTVAGATLGGICLIFAASASVYFLGDYQSRLQKASQQLSESIAEIAKKDQEVKEKENALTAANNSAKKATEKLASAEQNNITIDQSVLPLIEGIAYTNTSVTMPTKPVLQNVQYWWREPGEEQFKGRLIASSPPPHDTIEVAGFTGQKLATQIVLISKTK